MTCAVAPSRPLTGSPLPARGRLRASQLDLVTILLRAGASVHSKDHAKGGATAEELYTKKEFAACFTHSKPIASLRMWQRMLRGESEGDGD